MGQTTDDIIEGFTCCWCGIYFDDAHGYMVLCNDCHQEQARLILNGRLEQRNAIQKATIKELGE